MATGAIILPVIAKERPFNARRRCTDADDLTNVVTEGRVEKYREQKLCDAFKNLVEAFLAFDEACKKRQPAPLKPLAEANNRFYLALSHHAGLLERGIGSDCEDKLDCLKEVVSHMGEFAQALKAVCGFEETYSSRLANCLVRMDSALLPIECELVAFGLLL